MEHFLTVDILSMIGEYVDNAKDYIHLFQINKYVYNNILNNNETVLKNKIFKKDFIIYLNEKLPNYLFQLQNLNIAQEEEEIINFNLLEKFKYLKYLKIKKLPENFIFPNLPFLEELIIENSTLQENTLINLQQQLKILNLDECIVKDDCLNYLNNLQELKIASSDGLTGECLQNFKKLTKLELLYFNNGDFTKYILDLTNLKHLIIQKPIPENNSNLLNKLTNLEYLSIYLEEIKEKDFTNLTKLKTLVIESGNVLSENCFTTLLNLKELNVSNCTNFIGKCLLNLLNLEKLNVQNTDVKDEYFENLKNLKEIDLSGCNEITGECLLNLNNLEHLIIRNNYNLKDEFFKNLNNLKIVHLNDCQNLNGEFLQYLQKLEYFQCRNLNISGECLKKLSRLQSIDILQSPNITGEFLLNLTNLKSLTVQSNDNMKDEHFNKLQKLQQLYIEDCNNIIGNCLLNLSNLTYLQFNSKTVIDDHLQKLNNLKHLSITNCGKLTGKCFDYLINLISFSIFSNNSIKEEDLKKLVKLKYLCIYDCPQLLKKGDYLLNMDKLTGTVFFIDELDNKKINELKERIRKGETLEQMSKVNEF